MQPRDDGSAQIFQYLRNRGIPVDRVPIVIILLGHGLRRTDRVRFAVAVIGVRRYNPTGRLCLCFVIHRWIILRKHLQNENY